MSRGGPGKPRPDRASVDSIVSSRALTGAQSGGHGEVSKAAFSRSRLCNTRLLLRQSPALRVNYNGTQPVLSWDDPNVQLFGATNVAGPYILVSGATSPYPVPSASGLHYFRTSFTALP